MLDRNKIKIEVGEAKDSIIIGEKIGPDEDEIRKVVQEENKPILEKMEEFKSLLQTYQPNEIRVFRGHNSIADALFACESESASTLGFAVNNSGLLICSSSVHQITIARHLTSGEKNDVKCIKKRNMLQALRIDKVTRGLIPSYRTQPENDEKLFMFNDRGELIRLSVDSIYLTAKIEALGKILLIRNGFMARFSPPQKLFGGPVVNEAMEVMGIAVGASEKGYLVVQPWSKIESCVEMDVDIID